MDFLKAAIASSKSKLASKSPADDASDSTGKRKAPATEEQPVKRFKSRGEIEAERREKEQKEKVGTECSCGGRSHPQRADF